MTVLSLVWAVSFSAAGSSQPFKEIARRGWAGLVARVHQVCVVWGFKQLWLAASAIGVIGLPGSGALGREKGYEHYKRKSRGILVLKMRTSEGYAIHHDDMKVRSYAVLPADRIADSWSLADFDCGSYHLEVHGPNGFFRSFRGSKDDAAPDISCRYQTGTRSTKLTGNIELSLQNNNAAACILEIIDHYTKTKQTKQIDAHASSSLPLDLKNTYGWYDVSIKVKGNSSFEKRYAGKVETGKETFTDPMMGRVV